MNPVVLLRYLLLLLALIQIVCSANWAQLAGIRSQNTATPYVPDQWSRSPATSIRPMWSARWGHAVVVLNQAVPRKYLTAEQNSERAKDSKPILVLLGGDDGLPWDTGNTSFTPGKLRNDIWIGHLERSQSSWQVDERYFTEDSLFNPALIRSQMTWTMINPGRVPPPFWATDEQYPPPLTNDEWIACQDSIKHKLIDPSICNEPPIFCYDDIKIPGCNEQAVWKKENMWSPRRGSGAAVVNGKIFVIGGRAREYARISDSRLVGDIAGRGRVETSRDHSSIREDVVLKNDVWSSEDEGRTWKLVNPGCEDHQQDVLLDTEVWSRNISDPSLRQNIGSIGSRCFLSSDCQGIAECKDLANETNEKVCVCPMFSPREHHSLSVQHRFSLEDDGTIIEEDVMYVIGGFTTIKQSFCADRACGPSDGYKVALDDIWMSSDGVQWTQLKSAFDNSNNFTARGKHTSLVVPMSFQNDTSDMRDRLLIFGGETAHPKDLSTNFLNDVWELPLPHQPCCKPNTPCAGDYECTPSMSDFKPVTSNANWPARSGQMTIYEPPSSSNLFQPRIYLSGGSNDTTVHADVWSWRLDVKETKWVSLDAIDGTGLSEFDSYLSIDSPLPRLKIYELPELKLDELMPNFTAHSSRDIMNSKDFDIMSLANVSTIRDLALADLYTILKLRGFDYPGRVTRKVENVCLLREIALAFVEKCTLNNVHTLTNANPLQQPSNMKLPSLCGRGGEAKPCTEKDWDGCSPMKDVRVVDVHGLGDVDVPQIRHNVTRIVEELFCQQVPDGRALGAGVFVDSKAVILGGIDSNRKLLHRDVWARDEESPRAIIKTMPASLTPQHSFSFDSNEDGAHVFEYKLFREQEHITNWTITTSSIGADVSWLDDKKGGPGKGWYTLYVRAVDPAGNRDAYFSTQTNVYRWYYIPPVPWGAVSGGILTGLVLIIGGYFEYRRRRRKTILEKFALRRLKRKFKLKSKREGISEHNVVDDRPKSVTRERRSAELIGHLASNDDIMTRHRRLNNDTNQQHSLRRRHLDRPASGSTRKSRQSDVHPRSSRSHSTSRKSKSRPKAESDQKTKRRERRRTKEEAADAERRRRRRRDREMNRSKHPRDS